MQVKKFEAKSIKEAIEMVKYHLGPDAIILSAKENVNRFGMMGESSVEVTAAVSEHKLRQKKMAERKLDSRTKERYVKATAHRQKQFIDKVFDQSSMAEIEMAESEDAFEGELPVRAVKVVPPPIPKENGITSTRYVDIDNEAAASAAAQNIVPQATRAGARPAQPQRTQQQQAMQPQYSAQAQNSPQPVRSGAPADKITALQTEILYLKGLLDKFQRMPNGFVSMHPGGEDGLPYELSFIFKKLADAGVAHGNIVDILKKANQLLPAEQKKKAPFVDGWVIKYLLDHLQMFDKPFKKKFQIFLGPTGQGKTSTVVKLACQLIMKAKKKVALISGDHVKVGASDQFKIFAQILNAPYAMISSPQDWARLAPQLANVDYVFVDTPGVNLKNPADLDTIKNIMPPTTTDAETHYVQSIMARDTDAFEIADRFRIIGFNDVIFTRLDEAVQHGLIYNFQKKFQMPLHSFGIGNSIPDDFEMASKERVVDLIFNLSHYRKERG